MALENTITEQDLDAASQTRIQGFRTESTDFEPDLAVDGMNDSILSRLLSLIGIA